jgi:nitroreductase
MHDFAEAMEFRHACKRFDDAEIPEETFEMILEFGRLSPSSFGMEPWRFWVIVSDVLKSELRPLCWNQPQITECSHLVVIAADNESIMPGTDYVERMFARRGLPQEALERYLKVYAEHMRPQFHNREAVEAWTHKQCYIAAANMMTGAAALGIDSCPIEGFEKTKVEAALAFDPGYSAALILAFGYRLNPQGDHARLPMEQLVKRL